MLLDGSGVFCVQFTGHVLGQSVRPLAMCVCHVFHSIQMSSHQHAGPVQLGLRRPHRYPEHVRDLVVTVSLHVVEDENLPGPVRQLSDGSLDIEGVPGGATCRRDHPAQQSLAPRVPSLTFPLSLPPAEYVVHRQAVQPRPELGPVP